MLRAVVCLVSCYLSLTLSQDTCSGRANGDTFYSFVREDKPIGVPVEAADVVFLVDESGSMNLEHEWLLDVAGQLDDALKAKRVGVTSWNRFALVTFGGPRGDRLTGNVWTVSEDGGSFGTPAELRGAFTNLSVSGRFEDGYSAMNTALTRLQFRDNVARQFILITDENRDSLKETAMLTYQVMERKLLASSIILNVVVNHAFRKDGRQAFGIDRANLCYRSATTEKLFVSVANCAVVPGSGVGTTYDDYVKLAHQTGGAAWNLQQLRAGGETALSFTRAFVGIKVKEVISQVRSCRLCRCQDGEAAKCSTFRAETQAECEVIVESSTSSPRSPVPLTGGNTVIPGETQACTINGQVLQEGRSGNRYVVSQGKSGLSPPSADVIFVVDESGSMIGEHLWLKDTIYLLDDALRDDGIGETVPNRYGLVGFATHGRLAGSVHALSDGMMGTTTEFANAIDMLQTSGQVEDGYQAIATALKGFKFRSGNVAKQLILVTDEDRDATLALTSRKVRRLLEKQDFRVNVVVNHNIEDAKGNALLGIDAGKSGYTVGGTESGYSLVPNAILPGDGGYGTTLQDYVMLALDSLGAAWDLNQLRRGGAIARAFTNAFVDAKRREISEQLKVCQSCRCSLGRLDCNERPDATSADTCFMPARCKLGRRFINDLDSTVSYSIYSGIGAEAPMADVLVVVDESRSMIGEHKWLRQVIPDLDAALKARRVGIDEPNLFGLVGYASNGGGRKDNMGTVLMYDEKSHRMMGSAEEFRKVANKLRQVGRYEDGYSAVMRALEARNFRPRAARLVILVTDEDRDALNKSLTFDVVYKTLTDRKVILNAIINQGFAVNGQGALGIDGMKSKRGYFPVATMVNGSQQVTFRTKRGGAAVQDSGYGTTGDDYARLALETTGGAWDLNKLRKGGIMAKAFTRAFVFVKVKEAVGQLRRCRVCVCQTGEFKCGTVNKTKGECRDLQRQYKLQRNRQSEDLTDNLLGAHNDPDVTPLIEIFPPLIDICPGDGFTSRCYGRLGGVVAWNDMSSKSSANETEAELDVEEVGDSLTEYLCTASTNRWVTTATLSVNVINKPEFCNSNCFRMYGDGFTWIRRGQKASTPFSMSFRFCPSTVQSGVLYCLRAKGETSCRQCLVLNDGDLELQWSCCLPDGKPLRYSSHEGRSLQPDKCYNVSVKIDNDNAAISVDSVEVTTSLASYCSEIFRPRRDLYIGGTRDEGDDGYSGCMKELVCDRKPVLFHGQPAPAGFARVKRPEKAHRVRRCTNACG
eukprot:m.306561 g.306561  ORF g.306561 m.306561 type:complete len:1267 (+) comp41354_c0_seq1:1064-4864(+)